MWFSHFQSRKSSIGLLAWKRSDNLKFHTSLHSQPSGQWAECLSRHHQTYTGRRLLLCGGWRVLSILVKLVIDRWVIVVIDCTRSIVEYYCYLRPTYLLLWCQSIFKRSQNSLLSAAMMWNAICNTTTTKKEMGLLIEPNSHSQIPILCHYRLYRYVQ